MTPLEQLIALLARLIADGEITEAQAAVILAYWAGQQDAALARVLSLPVAVGVGEDDDAPPLVPWLIARTTPVRERVRLLGKAQDIHAANVAQLARDLEAGRITVAEWQRGVRAANAQLLADALVLAGAGNISTWRRKMQEIEREQAAYLQRFADEVSVRHLAQPVPASEGGNLPAALALWTAAYLARRAAMYSGAGRGLYYGAAEAGGVGGYGWVVEYRARDDDRTCSPCSDAQGFYLPGQGPLPGDVCLGGGFCRCERVPVFDEAMYRRLGGA